MQHERQPVTNLSLADMVNARIEYIYTQRIDGSADMIETGTIQSIKELHDGRLEMYVLPDDSRRMAKYRIAEQHLLRYLPTVKTVIENAVVA